MNDPLLEAAATLLGTTPDKVEVVELTIVPEDFAKMDMNDPPKPFVDFTPGPRYMEWINKVATLLDKDVEALKEDDCWYWCFDDWMRPEDAVAEYRRMVMKESP